MEHAQTLAAFAAAHQLYGRQPTCSIGCSGSVTAVDSATESTVFHFIEFSAGNRLVVLQSLEREWQGDKSTLRAMGFEYALVYVPHSF